MPQASASKASVPKLFFFSALLCFLVSAPLGAQYGGPMGGGGIPVPWGHKKKQKNSDPNAPRISADGKTVSNDGKTLVIDMQDGRTLTMKLNPETKFTRSGSTIPATKVVPRTTVHIEAAEDEEAYLTAIQVELLKDAAQATAEPETRAVSPAPGDEAGTTKPTIMHDPVDAPDRPILRRGIPKKTSSADSDIGNTDVSKAESPEKAKASASPESSHKETTDFTISDDSDSAKPAASASEALIKRTKEWSETFTNGLPNFVCQQSTTRYMQESKSSGWQVQDVVTAKVVYEDGKEDYREITVGGKKTNKGMLDLGGSTSTGEFASTLHSLFASSSQAQFKFYRSTTVGESAAAIYDFKVGLRDSNWFTKIGGQALRPAYSGSVWIDRSTAQVRRIEMQADNIPADFPLDSVQWAVDYENVRLGTASFLLPVHAENLACWRGSPMCTKNEVDFRDYHKYSGESTITFDK
ncbi:MAG: hypothetical protein ACR2IV_05590 [Bryobacteraceae bacterium]